MPDFDLDLIRKKRDAAQERVQNYAQQLARSEQFLNETRGRFLGAQAVVAEYNELLAGFDASPRTEDDNDPAKRAPSP